MKPQEKASRRRLLTQKAIEKKLTRLTSLEAQLAGAEAALKATGARRIELSSKVDQLKEQRSRRSLAGNVIRLFKFGSNDPEFIEQKSLESARREVGYEQWGRASEHKRLRTLIARIKKEVESASATLRALEREAEREAQLWARSDADRALLACAKATDRNRAAMLKRQIENSDIGPYCGDDLWPKRHLDHIFPIRQGGLSVTSNLVYVCAPCNLRKADLTLNEFIDVSELNREEVFRRLKALRKRY